MFLRRFKPALLLLYAALLGLQTIPSATADCTGAEWKVNTVLGIEVCGGGGRQPLSDLVNQSLTLLYVLAGGSAIIMIMFGAVRYMTAGSDAKQVQEAKDTMMSALTGLLLVLMSWAIAQTLGEILGVSFTEGTV